MTDLTDDPQATLLPYVAERAVVRRQGTALPDRVGPPARRARPTPPAAAGTARASPIDLVDVAYDDGEGDPDYYQLPLAFYAEPQEHLAHALIGEWDDESFGEALRLRRRARPRGDGVLAAAVRRHAPRAERPPTAPLRFHRLPGHDLDTASTRRCSPASSPTPRWPSARTR